MRNRLWLALLVAVLAACGSQTADPSGGAVPTATAPVVRTDVVSHQELDGTLTYAGSYTLINQTGPGIYTSLPAPGTVVTRGQVLYRVDNRPIPLLYGEPEWRTLEVGVTDGPDVKQLEQNLLALGFANSTNLIASGHFDSFDAAAIRRWQRSLGAVQTGVLNPGDALFEPEPIRIAAVHPVAGMTAQPGQPVIEATSTRQVVTVSLDVSRESLIKVGDPVIVSLPSSKPVNGSIASIGTVATTAAAQAGQTGPATVLVTVLLADVSAGSGLDEAAVTVSIAARRAPSDRRLCHAIQNLLGIPITVESVTPALPNRKCPKKSKSR